MEESVHSAGESQLPVGNSTTNTSRRRRARGCTTTSNACHVSDPINSRQKRRRLLQQHRMVWGGAASVRSANLECGQFDEDFVSALKVSYPERSYYGAPEYECPHCHAIFWYGERVGKDSRQSSNTVIYNNCCRGGKVVIPPFRPRPEPLASLARFDGDANSNKFMRNIRPYNCLFAFTSMGANIDRSMNDGRGPPVFKIYGQVHHRIGSLLPPDGAAPKFIQLYVYDTANEVQNRIQSLHRDDGRPSDIDPDIVQSHPYKSNQLLERNLWPRRSKFSCPSDLQSCGLDCLSWILPEADSAAPSSLPAAPSAFIGVFQLQLQKPAR